MKRFWIGASFRSSVEAVIGQGSSFDSVDFWMGMRLKNGLRFGLAYDYPLNSMLGPGIGSYECHDPHSEFWLSWQKKKNKTSYDWDTAYEVLSRESFRRVRQFESEYGGEGVILMDRSHFSRWFVLRQRDKNSDLRDSISELTLLPNKYFIFDVSKETLL